MVISCPVCRDVVHVSQGYILRHGYSHHGLFDLCAGSGTPITSIVECCGL